MVSDTPYQFVISAYCKKTGETLPDNVAKGIYDCLCSLGIDDFATSSRKIVDDLFTFPFESGLGYVPIDIIELRLLLKNSGSEKKCLLSHKFVDKYMADKSLMLCCNLPKGLEHGGICLLDEPLNVGKTIRRVLVSGRMGKEEQILVQLILNEEGFDNVELGINDKVPGLTMARNMMKMRKEAQQEVPTITLNDKEQQIINFILAAKNHFPQLKDVQLRIAGGWVRDKLLGKESDDIDIAVSHIPGIDFARYLEKYAMEQDIKNVDMAYEVSLEKSSDKSKADNIEPTDALKVGGIGIFGQKIEFVNLRTEQYDPNSRVPKIVATNSAELDVRRRDLSVNSLYYNLETQQVEDYVGGISDLKNKILRTPTDPQKTFDEDPLRMLRVLRFFSKMPGFSIDPAIISVMEQSKDPNSQFSQNYQRKVHPSRASKELRKLLEGKNPIEASRLLLSTGFYKLVFDVPQDWHPVSMDQQSPHHNLTLMDHTLEVMNELKNTCQQQNTSPKECGLLLLSALLHDFGKMAPDIRQPKMKGNQPVTFDRNGQPVEHMRYIAHEGKSYDFSDQILKNMGFQPEERNFVTTIIQKHMEPHQIDAQVISLEAKEKELLPKIEQLTKQVEELEQSGQTEQQPTLSKQLFGAKKLLLQYTNELNNAKSSISKHLGKLLRDATKIWDDLSASVKQLETEIMDPDIKKLLEDKRQWLNIYKNLPERVFEHGRADQLAKGELSPKEREQLEGNLARSRQFLDQYRKDFGILSNKPLLDGNEIRSLAITHAPEMAKADGFMLGKGKPVHFIKYITNDLLEQQSMGNIKDKEQALNYVQNNFPRWQNVWKQQQKQAGSWYKRVKLADASSGQDSSGYDGYEDHSPLERTNEPITHVRHGIIVPFETGQKVILHNYDVTGIGGAQVIGKVIHVSPIEVVVKWETGLYKGKTEKMTMDKAQLKLDKIT